MKYRHIIIEGADGTGKSTLARKFADAGFTYIHADKPRTKSWLEEYVRPIDELERRNERGVLDRWHVGEMVWPRVFGRESLFSTDSYNMCCQILHDARCLAIIVLRSDSGIRAELFRRGERDQIADALDSQRMFVDVALRTWAMDTLILDSDYLHRMEEPWKLL